MNWTLFWFIVLMFLNGLFGFFFGYQYHKQITPKKTNTIHKETKVDITKKELEKIIKDTENEDDN